MINTVILDIDGSLMNPSAGLYVCDEIRDKLIELQRRGVMVILNSARTFQGVEPLAYQIKMDEFGGYLISCNGCHVYDIKKKETVFEYTIDQQSSLKIWEIARKHGLKGGFTQPDYVVCEELTHGYYLDKENCQVDYMVTHDPVKHSSNSIWKCTLSETKEIMDACFEDAKKEIEENVDVLIVRSTPYMADIVNSTSDKLVACSRLLDLLHIDWKDVSCIGDGLADLGCVKTAGLGVTLENAKPEVKAVADMIVPSCEVNGAIVWLDALLEGKL